jgi:anti-sigma B factor antagonist
MSDIKISVSESGAGGQGKVGHAVSVVRIDGVIDTLTATQLEEVLEKLLLRERYEIIFDLAGVDYISSAGWGIFISRIKEIRDKQGDIKLANMVPNVQEIYELLEFDNILSSHESVEAARSAISGGDGDQSSKKKAN